MSARHIRPKVSTKAEVLIWTCDQFERLTFTSSVFPLGDFEFACQTRRHNNTKTTPLRDDNETTGHRRAQLFDQTARKAHDPVQRQLLSSVNFIVQKAAKSSPNPTSYLRKVNCRVHAFLTAEKKLIPIMKRCSCRQSGAYFGVSVLKTKAWPQFLEQSSSSEYLYRIDASCRGSVLQLRLDSR